MTKKLIIKKLLGLSGTFLFLFVLVTPSYGSEEKLFSIHGSNTIGARLGPALAEAYLLHLGAEVVKIYPGARENEVRIKGYVPKLGKMASIHIAAHGSSSGFKAMKAGNAEIAAASRPIKAKEQAMLAELGNFSSRNAEYVVGIDGLAVIVHPNNPVSRLDLDQIAKLFSGEITNWKQLGGPDRAVKLFARDDRSGTWDTFKSLVLAKKYALAQNARRFESNAQLSKEVQATPGGIGFVSLNTIGESKPLMISDGTDRALQPYPLHVSTEDYILSRRLYMYLPEQNPDPEAKAFLDFVVSEAAQPVVASVGYIHQSVELVEPDLKTAPKEYQKIVDAYDRASVNFRFDKGKARLDNKALLDVERLSKFVAEQPGELLLIGFAEPNDKPERNELLARLRADVVRRSLIKAGISRKLIRYEGYGNYLALSSAETLTSRIRNRRVEVWFRPKSFQNNALAFAQVQ